MNIETVADGVWSIPSPLPFRGLPIVNVYVIEGGDGLYLIDAGWGSDKAFGALEAALDELGRPISEVRGVLVTHSHRDHLGLAARVHDASGAWIALHAADLRYLERMRADPDTAARLDESYRVAGVPEADRVALVAASHFDPIPVLDDPVALADDEVVDLGGRPLRVHGTPGHTPGSACFSLPDLGILFSGDHILPRITPHISFDDRGTDNPLEEYMASLERLRDLPIALVCPAHEQRFADLAGRVDVLLAHHRERLGEVVSCLSRGPATVWGVAQQMTWSHPWATIGPTSRRVAIAEARSHLEALRHRGSVVRSSGSPLLWKLKEAADV